MSLQNTKNVCKGDEEVAEEHLTETVFAQIGNKKDEHFQAVSTPIYFSTAYRHEEVGLTQKYDYIRTGNPTRDILEEGIAAIEKGDRAFACSSGMSAIQLVFSLFKKGDHIIASRDIYGGSFRFFTLFEEKYGIHFSYWDGQGEGVLTELIQENTRAIFIETPTNPLMKTTNLQCTAKQAEENNLLLIVDNTLYTPYIQQPIEEGADIVIHSGTKYLAGHNDVLAGIVISKGKTINKQLAYLHNSFGAVLSPFDCWSLMRGMKTLALRMKQHEKNAKLVISYLEEHPLVTKVFYPGRGGMISFEIVKEHLVNPFLNTLNLFTFAESFGGVESMITYPATQTHMDIPQEMRESYGLSNRLLRLSIGIEHANDLLGDLKQAFDKVSKGGVL